MYTVQKNVPLPKVQKVAGTRQRKYPFEDLTVGAFFFIPDRDKNNMSAHASNVGRDLGRKFATRLVYMRSTDDETWEVCDKDDDGAVLGIGVWRTA